MWGVYIQGIHGACSVLRGYVCMQDVSNVHGGM